MNNIIIPELHNSKIRRTDDDKYSVLDVIRVVAGKKGHTQLWKKIKKDYKSVITLVDYAQFLDKAGRKNKETPVMDKEGILYLIGLLPGEVGKQYREKAANLVRRYVEGDSDLGLEIMIRDRNKERFERVKRRMQVVETNKEVAKIVSANPGTRYSDVHNDRYKGLYEKTSSQLRLECGAKDKETPLNYMSDMDLNMNSLVNQVAIKKNNPNAIYGAALSMRNWYESQMGEKLEPAWEDSCLPPAKARKQLEAQQLVLPV